MERLSKEKQELFATGKQDQEARLPDGSRMKREFHVRFCERLSGRFRWATHFLIWGDLASCLKGQRRKTELEVSRGRSSQDSDEGPNEKESQNI